jgi:hypothetical protein
MEKEFQLIHVSSELGTRSIIVTEQDIEMDMTTPAEEKEQMKNMNVGDKIIIHFGKNPVKTGNLIRRK